MPLGNRVTEKDLRNWLDTNGWYGKSAQIGQLDLHAIRRPGWEQVFSFSLQAKRKPDAPDDAYGRKSLGPESRDTLWGVIHDDERFKANRPSIWVFVDKEEQSDKLEELSAELVVLRHGDTSAGLLPTIAIIAALVLLACVAKFFAQ